MCACMPWGLRNRVELRDREARSRAREDTRGLGPGDKGVGEGKGRVEIGVRLGGERQLITLFLAGLHTIGLEK